jgi:hypothetical protein
MYTFIYIYIYLYLYANKKECTYLLCPAYDDDDDGDV